MTEKQERFAEVFKANNKSLSGEALTLFQEILAEEMDDDPEKMAAFMQTFEEPKPQTLSLAEMQDALLELTHLMLGGE